MNSASIGRPRDAEAKAAALLAKCGSAALASVTGGGFPRVCEMEIVRADGIREIYFTTVRRSEKVRLFLADSRAGASFHHGSDSASLIGRVEVAEDMETKRMVWRGEHVGRFAEEGGGPKYCILKFTAAEGRFFIGGEKLDWKP